MKLYYFLLGACISALMMYELEHGFNFFVMAAFVLCVVVAFVVELWPSSKRPNNPSFWLEHALETCVNTLDRVLEHPTDGDRNRVLCLCTRSMINTILNLHRKVESSGETDSPTSAT